MSSLDGGVTFSYQNIPGSPFNVSVGILDLDIYNSYDNLVIGGFGVTAISFMDTFPIPKAG